MVRIAGGDREFWGDASFFEFGSSNFAALRGGRTYIVAALISDFGHS
jgi:hypothetical protein